MAEGPAPPPRTLIRPTDDRHVGGVCSGVARYLGVDAAPVRIIWAVLALVGPGIPAYLIAWIVIPDADGTQGIDGIRAWLEEHSLPASPWLIGAAIAVGVLWLTDGFDLDGAWIPVVLIGGGVALLLHDRGDRAAASDARPDLAANDVGTVVGAVAGAEPELETRDPLLIEAERLWDPPLPPPPPPPTPSPSRRPKSRLGRWAFGLMVLGLGAVGLAASATDFDPDPTTVMAVALLWLGTVLIVSAWFGRARGLLPVGGVLIACIALTSAIDVPLAGGIGDRTVVLSDPADVDPDGHRLLLGSLEVDLTSLAVDGETPVEASVTMGELILVVDADQAIALHAHVDVGQIVEESAGRRTTADEGVDVDLVRGPDTPTDAAEIEVELDVGVGEITIRTIDEETP